MMFDAITLDELVDWVEGRDPMASFEYVVTPNVDHVVRLDVDVAGGEPGGRSKSQSGSETGGTADHRNLPPRAPRRMLAWRRGGA